MAATETFVEAKIKEAEEKWRQQLHEETTQAKVELAKIKEEIQDMKAVDPRMILGKTKEAK